MKHIAAIIIISAVLFAADRVVLLENFTNSGCGPCWNIETTLNNFINPHLAAEDLSVVRVHVWWPSASDPIYVANPTEQTARVNYYSVSGVPTLKMDGILTCSAYNLSGSFTSRMNAPCYLGINVSKEDDKDTGTLHISLTAEQSLGSEVLTLHAILVEDNVSGAGYWAGSYFEQAFRDNLCGASGQTVTFTGSYPSTVNIELPYGTQGWNEDEVSLCLFLQGQTSKEVFNAYFEPVMDIPSWTGISEVAEAVTPVPSVVISPNPSTGSFVVASTESGSSFMTAELYDIVGRLVDERTLIEGSSTFQVEETGVYVLMLRGQSGQTFLSRVVVTR